MTRRWMYAFSFVLSLFLGLACVSIADAAEIKYVGARKCKMCHKKQYKSWKKTSMANAFELLKPGVEADDKKRAGLDPSKDYTTDSTCLECHTTGYGKPGGFVDFKTTPKLVGIQCEACHGAGKKYLKLMMKNPSFKHTDAVQLGLMVPDEKTCLECHNNKNPLFEGEFNFDEAIKKGVHEHFELKKNHH